MTKENKKINVNEEKKIFYVGLIEIMGLNLKIVLHPKYIIFLGIILPFLITMSFSMFLPIWMGFIYCVSTSLVVTSASTFSALFFSYTEGTMKQNLNLTKGSKNMTIFSILLSMLITNFITISTVIITLIIITLPAISIGLMSFNGTMDEEPLMNWSKVSWDVIAYYWVMFTLIIFSLSLFSQRFVSSKKSYFILLLSYILIAFIFGGSMALTWGVNEDDKIVLANDDTGINPFASISSLCQGSPLWWVCQFMPTFHINQFAYNSIITGVYFDENATFNGGMDRLQESITSLEGINLFNLVKSSAMWKYYFSMPYVYIVVYFALYKIHEKYL